MRLAALDDDDDDDDGDDNNDDCLHQWNVWMRKKCLVLFDPMSFLEICTLANVWLAGDII